MSEAPIDSMPSAGPDARQLKFHRVAGRDKLCPRLGRSCAGGGSSLRSTFPLSVNGSALSTTKAEGIM